MTVVGEAPTVRVAGGRVAGRLDGGVAAFLGIPYAAAPFGPRRLLPPAPPVPWEGVRDAGRYGPTCPKGPGTPLFPEVVIDGEDCLNLNVWTPDPHTTGLPVLVWIHGGAFTTGAGSLPGYRGSSFARDGVVCVTINYRLGAEGFLYLGDGVANLGLLDQLAALAWVRDNIAAFGGDPDRVTVAGQSAGAVSVATLLAVPRSAGLFGRAIAQSGSAARTLTPDAAVGVAARLAAVLHVAPTRAAFREVPAGELARASAALVAASQVPHDPTSWDVLPFAPVIDGDTLPAHPFDAVRGGAGRGVRLLTGWNRDDTRIGLVPTGLIDAVDETMLAGVVAALGGPDGTVQRYRSARPGASSGELLAAVTTDRSLRLPITRGVEARLAGGATGNWLYRFDHASSSFGGRLGAAHAVELPYVFDLLDDESTRPLIGADPSPAVAQTVHGAWVRFVAAGDPGWPRYDQAGRDTALIGAGITVAADPDGELRDTWSG
ncbi:carboxylic ester hydrolase [Actinocatenispora thailandica]|uniref:Carboxylic ester hydrolase n=1 Tax=Actinocatenispora thailandica TaxID=227318 RepID=A0A7R7DQL8_9ACTN|nr:carboxylesterase family protein [Actinocatenispora thailandica]BCJ36043.1 carboxylic ester hydrolase [Actinocatenispora thailandica]